jgi:hypothetical protein
MIEKENNMTLTDQFEIDDFDDELDSHQILIYQIYLIHFFHEDDLVNQELEKKKIHLDEKI